VYSSSKCNLVVVQPITLTLYKGTTMMESFQGHRNNYI